MKNLRHPVTLAAAVGLGCGIVRFFALLVRDVGFSDALWEAAIFAVALGIAGGLVAWLLRPRPPTEPIDSKGPREPDTPSSPATARRFYFRDDAGIEDELVRLESGLVREETDSESSTRSVMASMRIWIGSWRTSRERTRVRQLVREMTPVNRFEGLLERTHRHVELHAEPDGRYPGLDRFYTFALDSDLIPQRPRGWREPSAVRTTRSIGSFEVTLSCRSDAAIYDATDMNGIVTLLGHVDESQHIDDSLLRLRILVLAVYR